MDARWTSADLPSFDGRTVMITGANSGVGLSTASAFAGAGAHVVLAVRDVERGRQAARVVGGSNEVRRLDLADLESVRHFGESWQGPLDVLVNNAGVNAQEARTKDGFELHFGTNHLGHFALTNLLLPHLTDRVVTLASGAHRFDTFRFDDLDLRKSGYRQMKAYGRSKLANLLFVLELQRRLRHAGSELRSLAAHPGFSATNLGTAGRGKFLVGAVHLAEKFLAQSSEKGALNTLFAASQDLPGASYVGPDGRFEMHGYPTLVGRSAEASDIATAQRLWDLSEELTGVPFGLSQNA